MFMKKILRVKIDGQEFLAMEGQSILELANQNNIFIPNLCHHPNLTTKANCRVCVVEIKGRSDLYTACSTLVEEGMEILTNSPLVKRVRDTNLKLIFSEHLEKCGNCILNFNCDLLDLARRYQIKITTFNDRKIDRITHLMSSALEIDGAQCIDCQNCLEACSEIQGIDFLELKGSGVEQEIVPSSDPAKDCIYCGQCTLYCPSASVQEQAQWPEVEALLKDKQNKILVAQIAPASRFSIGEEFGLKLGGNYGAQLVEALKILGFDYVLDVNFGADMTTIVEAEEFKDKLINNPSSLPLFSSCCPAWVKYLEFYHPELVSHLSLARSPHLHLGAAVKELGFKDKEVIVVSIMPCTAKKFEISRDEFQVVDYVLTVREIAYLLKRAQLDLKDIAGSDFDDLFGSKDGAGLIYGSSGGLSQSILRLLGLSLNLFGNDGIKEGEVQYDDKKLRIAVVNGIKNFKPLLTKLSDYDYIEVMACPGGCLGGGGQPLSHLSNIVELRQAGLWQEDQNNSLRVASDNLAVQKVLKKIDPKFLNNKIK